MRRGLYTSYGKWNTKQTPQSKKTHVRLGGSLTIKDGLDSLDQKDVDEQIMVEEGNNRGRGGSGQTKTQRCRKCSKPGHNVRACKDNISNLSALDTIIVDS